MRVCVCFGVCECVCIHECVSVHVSVCAHLLKHTCVKSTPQQFEWLRLVHQTGPKLIFEILERSRLKCNLNITVPQLSPPISNRELTEPSTEYWEV